MQYKSLRLSREVKCRRWAVMALAYGGYLLPVGGFVGGGFLGQYATSDWPDGQQFVRILVTSLIALALGAVLAACSFFWWLHCMGWARRLLEEYWQQERERARLNEEGPP